ncbi:translation initiation factor IF-2 [Brevundimonas lenta]|uniref:Translation initiation factor IF-2 n=1 Tax=Brevundimonas lenta TaxID=424796 RepID=A0A7W6NMM6_9CAUL|nr:translation initiation factor IF-2 [Brevundimonas lenta]MBB4081525.1 hypothetical protein [Brevundimonas lenta]
MSARLFLAAALVVGSLAGPALARQQPAAPPAAQAPAEPRSDAEMAMNARGEAFSGRMDQMKAELQVAMDDPATDAAGKTAATDAILNRYQPEIDAFAGELEAFFRSEAGKPENVSQRDQLLAAADAAPPAIRGIPQIVRTAVQQALTAPPAAAAPQ